MPHSAIDFARGPHVAPKLKDVAAIQQFWRDGPRVGIPQVLAQVSAPVSLLLALAALNRTPLNRTIR